MPCLTQRRKHPVALFGRKGSRDRRRLLARDRSVEANPALTLTLEHALVDKSLAEHVAVKLRQQLALGPP